MIKKNKHSYISVQEYEQIYGKIFNSKKNKNKENKPKNKNELIADINKIDPFFKLEPYLDGDGEPRIGFDNVIANIELLNKKKIDGFIIHWMDYTDMDIFDELLDQIKKLNYDLDWYHSYLIYPTIHGMFITNNRIWYIEELYLQFRSRENKYQVSEINKNDLSLLLVPISLRNDYSNLETSKNPYKKYKILLRIGNNNSIMFQEYNNKKFTQSLFEFLKKELSSIFDISIKDMKNSKDIMGETFNREYKINEIFDKSLDIDKYIEEVNKENEKYYNNDYVMKILRNKC